MDEASTRPVELEPLIVEPGSDADVLGVYRVGGVFVAGSAAFGLLMSMIEEDLSPRDRGVASLASVATLALGVQAARDPAWFGHLTHQRRLASALPWAGVATTWITQPARSPMMFPAMFLTALGAAKVGVRAGLGIGAASASMYLAGVTVSRRRKVRDKRLIWNAGVTAGYVSAGYVAPLMARVAFSLRALEHARRRDRQLVDPSVPSVRELKARADAIGSKARRIDEALVRLQRVDLVSEDARSRLHEATEDARAKAIAYGVAPILMRAARGETIDLVGNLLDIVDAHRRVRGDVPLEWDADLPVGYAVDGRATAAAAKVLQNALANTFAHARQDLTVVRVRLRDTGTDLVLTIDDDGGGDSPARLGEGLMGARAACQRLGGNLEFPPQQDGVRVVAHIPRETRERTNAPGSIVEQLDQTIGAIARVQTINCWLQGIGCIAIAERTRGASGAAVVFTLLATMNYRREQRHDPSPWTAAAHVAAMSVLWPKGGRPPSGLIGNALLIFSVAEPRKSIIPAVAATAATCAAAARVRDSVPAVRIVECVAFPVICAVMGTLGGTYGRNRMLAAEAETGSLRDRAEMVEEAANAGGVVHDLIEPLRGVPGWWSDLRFRPEAADVVDLVADVTSLMRDLSLRVAPVDPLEELQRYLATILAPTLVTVGGDLPAPEIPSVRSEQSDRDLSARRSRAGLDLITLADAVAAHILDSYPINLQGKWSLEHVHIAVTPASRGRVEVVIQPNPARRGNDGHNARMQAALSRLPHGEFKEGFDDARRTFVMAAEALLPRSGSS